MFYLLAAYAAQGQIITAFAGNGTSGYAGDGGQATAAEVSDVHWVATDRAGNVYISDLNRHIRKVNAAGTITTIAGDGGCCYSGSGGPALSAAIGAVGVTADGIGNVYFSTAVYNVGKVDTAGIFTNVAGGTTFGSSGDGGPATTALLYDPLGVAVDLAGNIYFCDQGNNKVRKVNTAGIITTFAGTGSYGFSGDGGAATAAQLGLTLQGIAADSAGNVYIVDNGNMRIRMVNTAGIITTVAGGGATGYVGDGGPATASGSIPDIGVAVDGCGNLYISGATYIRKVNAAGIITTIAGTGTTGFSGNNGPATAATLSVWGITVDGYGNVYTGEYTRVRKIGTANHAPLFTGSHSITVCENSGASSIDAAAAVMDVDTLQTEIWNMLTVPAHGTAAAHYVATSTGDTLIPAGLYYTPTAGYSGNDSFTVTITDCDRGADTISIHVAIVTSTSGVTGASILCAGSPITLSDTTGSGTWSSGATTIATVGTASGIVIGVAAGTAMITYSLGTECTATKVITVNATPAITGVAAVCAGATTALSETISGGTWSSTNTAAASVGTGGVITGVAGGSATISYILGTGCGTALPVTVNATPGAITGTTSVCAGSTTAVSNSTSGGTWSSDNTAVATTGTGTGTIMGVAAGTAIITYTLPAGCIATTIVTVNPLPDVITGSTTVCVGGAISLTDTTASGSWSSSNTGIATAGTAGLVSATLTGVAAISYTLPTGCAVYHPVTVNPTPPAISGAGSLCAGATIALSIGSTSSLSGGAWSSSNTAIATAGTIGIVEGVSSGTATIVYH